MKRKLTALFLSAIMTFSSTVTIFADDDITVKLNDSNIEFDQAPIVESGRTLVPFRAILEAMNVDVDWDADTKTITCTKGDKVIKLTIGENEMFINDEEVTLDVPAKIVNGRTLLPLRAISENLDAEVKWDSDTKTIEIKSNNSSNEEQAEETQEATENQESNSNETAKTYIEEVDSTGKHIFNTYSLLSDFSIFEDDTYKNKLKKIEEKTSKFLDSYDENTTSVDEAKKYLEKITAIYSELVSFADSYNLPFTYFYSFKTDDKKIDVTDLNENLMNLYYCFDGFHTLSNLKEPDKKTVTAVKKALDDFSKIYKPYIFSQKIKTQSEADELNEKTKMYLEQVLKAFSNNSVPISVLNVSK